MLFILVLAMHAGPLPSANANPTALASLVIHLTFDESGGTVAHDSAGHFDGTLVGGAAFVDGGIAGRAVSLTQATGSLVNLGTSFPAFGSGDFSLVAWVKTTTTADDTHVVSRHNADDQNGWFIVLNQSGGGGAAGKATFYASNNGVASAPTSTTTVNDDVWHQIVGVYTAGGSQRIYVDGAPVETAVAAAPIVAEPAAILIGGVNSGGSPVASFDGLVDDVQVYSAALTDAQIRYLFAHPGRVASTVQYDLATDWSDAQNPNGVWTYREGANALPHVASWQSTVGGYSSAQPGWARSANGTDRLPVWYKTLGVETFPNDFVAGDVACYSTDGTNGIGNGDGTVAWTSPFDGVVDVSGNVWIGRENDLSNNWFVYLNGVLLTYGNVASGDPFDRAHPMTFADGNVLGSLEDVAVATGDEITFVLDSNGMDGELAGVNVTITRPVPATPAENTIVSYFLPKSLKLTLKGAGKDSLTTTGSFDDGNLPVDLTQPVTIEVGGFAKMLTLTAKGPDAFAFKDATTKLTLKTHQKGSSRGRFKLKVRKTTLAGLIDPNATIALHFHASGLPDALGIVKLTKGSFVLGRKRGDLVAPSFFPAKAKITVHDAKPDGLSFSGGFGNAGPAPAALGDVHIAVGDTFDQTVAGSAFTRKGNVFSHRDKTATTALAVSLDFDRGIMKVKAKGIEVGSFASPTADFVVDVGGGDPPAHITVRFGGNGAKRVY
jgi:hypothetical protein